MPELIGYEKVKAHPFGPLISKLDDVILDLEDAMNKMEPGQRGPLVDVSNKISKASNDLYDWILKG